MTTMQEYYIDIKPYKIMRGKGLCKLFDETRENNDNKSEHRDGEGKNDSCWNPTIDSENGEFFWMSARERMKNICVRDKFYRFSYLKNLSSVT